MASVFTFLGIAVVGLILGSVGWTLLMTRSEDNTHRRGRARASEFPVITEADAPRGVLPLNNDGPGRYSVIGVVTASQTDIKLEIEAESLANARVKAELRGLIVTDIQKHS